MKNSPKTIINSYFIGFILILLFTNGFQYDTNLTGKGFIQIGQLLIFPLTLVIIFFNIQVINSIQFREWIIFTVLLSLMAINFSRLGSVFLIINNFFLIKLLQNNSIKNSILDVINSVKLQVVLIALILIALLNTSNSIFWDNDSKFLALPRLQLLNSEASHFALSLAPIILLTRSKAVKTCYLIAMILSQSYLGLLFLGLLHFIKYKAIRYLLIILFIFIISIITNLEFSDFISNSGLARLVGISLFQNTDNNIINYLIGFGVGQADNVLEYDFNSVGIIGANSFIFGAIYDLGLIGMLLYFYLFCNNSLKHQLLLLFLLLNFGLGNFMLSIILGLSFIVSNNNEKSKSI
jgi:hypothetical protein